MWTTEKQQQFEKFIAEFMSDLQYMSPEDVDFILSHKLECSLITIRIQKIKLAIELMKTYKDKEMISSTLCLHAADTMYIY
jgi:hypothetical protein